MVVLVSANLLASVLFVACMHHIVEQILSNSMANTSSFVLNYGVNELLHYNA